MSTLPYVTYTGGGGGGYVPVTSTTISTGPTPGAVFEAGGTLELRGGQADLVINGVSLTKTLKGIQDRLNILRPNTELEAEWDQLRNLGEQYRQLEAKLLEKQRMWEILKK